MNEWLNEREFYSFMQFVGTFVAISTAVWFLYFCRYACICAYVWNKRNEMTLAYRHKSKKWRTSLSKIYYWMRLKGWVTLSFLSKLIINTQQPSDSPVTLQISPATISTLDRLWTAASEPHHSNPIVVLYTDVSESRRSLLNFINKGIGYHVFLDLPTFIG